MSAGSIELRVRSGADGYSLVGEASVVELVNEFLRYLADRNYSSQTVRAYAFDLLHFARWLSGERLALDVLDTDALLRYLSACRTTVLPHQRGGNVYAIRDGRSSGYAPRTINRRLAALSALFAFRGLRDPAAVNPVPRDGKPATRPAGSARGCSVIWRGQQRGRGCGCVSRVGCLAVWTRPRRRRCWEALAASVTVRSSVEREHAIGQP